MICAWFCLERGFSCGLDICISRIFSKNIFFSKGLILIQTFSDLTYCKFLKKMKGHINTSEGEEPMVWGWEWATQNRNNYINSSAQARIWHGCTLAGNMWDPVYIIGYFEYPADSSIPYISAVPGLEPNPSSGTVWGLGSSLCWGPLIQWVSSVW